MLDRTAPDHDSYIETVMGAYDGSGYAEDLQAVVFASRLYDPAPRGIDDTFVRGGTPQVYSQPVQDYLDDELYSRPAFPDGRATRKFTTRTVDAPDETPEPVDAALALEERVDDGALMENLVRSIPPQQLSSGDPVDMAAARHEFDRMRR